MRYRASLDGVHVGDLSGRCPEWAKSVEYELDGIHVITRLHDLFEQPIKDLIASCNPKHVIGHAWIAIPDSVTLNEEHAHRIYQAVGAWRQQSAA